MKLVTASEMRELDRRAIQDLGIPSLVLMENAGRTTYQILRREFPDLQGEVAVVAGRGNNGGDGFVIARYLANAGIPVAVFLLGPQEQVSGDARVNLEILAHLGIAVAEVLTEAERKGLEDWAAHQANGTVVHVPINSTRPHTLAFALNDSPAGLAAWLVDKYRSYSDCDGDVETSFTRDELLAEITTYWVTGTIASASRLYYERAHERSATPTRSRRIEVPTGCAIFPGDVRRVPRPWAERLYNVQRWTEMPSGGHFPGLEEPELLVAELRAFFRPLR